jgi:hypothetical protein
MKKFLLSVTLFGVALIAGCGSPCDALSEMCTKCKDANVKTSCEMVVRSYQSLPGGGTACQAVLDAKTYGSCQ